MKFNGRVYDVLKALAQIYIPAAATFYGALAGIWGLPDVTQVLGSTAALDAFLGVILAISSAGYIPPTDGSMVVDKSNPAKDVYTLALAAHPSTLAAKKSITLAVTPATSANLVDTATIVHGDT